MSGSFLFGYAQILEAESREKQNQIPQEDYDEIIREERMKLNQNYEVPYPIARKTSIKMHALETKRRRNKRFQSNDFEFTSKSLVNIHNIYEDSYPKTRKGSIKSLAVETEKVRKKRYKDKNYDDFYPITRNPAFKTHTIETEKVRNKRTRNVDHEFVTAPYTTTRRPTNAMFTVELPPRIPYRHMNPDRV